MRLEMVDEDAGIQEHVGAGGHVGIGHACSCGSSSGLIATKSASSWLPVQPIKPAVCRTRLTAVFTVTQTFSCSWRGSGLAGLSTPFSYTASTVMAMRLLLRGLARNPRDCTSSLPDPPRSDFASYPVA